MGLLSVITGKGKVTDVLGTVSIEDFTRLVEENEMLRKNFTVLKKEFEDFKREISAKMTEFTSAIEDTKQTVIESATTQVIGKTKVLNQPLVDALKRRETAELRQKANTLASRIRKKIGGRPNAPWTLAYGTLKEVTGFDVFAHEKESMCENGKTKGPSYLNTVIKKGYMPQLVLILESLDAETI
ncbi:hypothetical protein [Aneurinibacillus aneurinilyticus]|uniref:Uncharacterized protein n=1 Tax=Aneurinibacillus aneurinilyticus TaxID=1391 RepID=A0A848CZY0_ANEAE|nr:hypothetical protein [Aneurinibacillus aneurinilyticus]NMF00060.1 hypothetical protein [Aneurinibacillus aneurinilyticus]